MLMARKISIRTWKKNFLSHLGISLVEWSISNESFYKNPIFDNKFNSDLNTYMKKYNLHINSIVLILLFKHLFEI